MSEPTDNSSSLPVSIPGAAWRRALGVAVIAVGVLASIIAFWSLRQVENGRNQAEFERRAQSAAHLITDGLKRHQDTLYSMRTLFHFSKGVERAEFAGAAREFISRQAGVRALEWVQRVPGHDRGTVEAAARAAGFSDFAFRERVTGNFLRPIDSRDEYFPVMYIEPLAGNEPALGFDMRSGVTWPLLEKIAGTNELAASGRLPLLTPNSKPDWGYIMQLPVY